MSAPDFVIITARDEARTLPATLAALASAFPDALVLVADDGSRDATNRVAAGAGAEVLSGERTGKGGAATRAARRVAELASDDEAIVLLCDADLGESAGRLGRLTDEIHGGHADLAVAAFARPQRAGFGIAVGFARRAIRRRYGRQMRAPISGQRALRAGTLSRLVPFGPGFGMELGMTLDALRAGLEVVEVDVDLSHRATGRTPAGFVHRARQLVDFVRVYRARG